MRAALLCDAVRTPIGRYGGALSQVRTDDIAAAPICELIKRYPKVDWSRLDEVILGCANQAGEDNRNIGRMALLLAGLPMSVPGTTVNRLCGSGMDAIGTAARAVQSGEADFVIAGGAESMSRAPFVMGKAESAFQRSTEVYDTTIGWRFVNPRMRELYGVDSMPETGENVARDYAVGRGAQDAFAWRSQMRTERAVKDGFTPQEVEAAKASVLEQRRLARSQDRALASRLSNYLFVKRSFAWDIDFEKKIAALEPAEVNAALRKHIDPARLSVVVAGDLKK